MATILIVEDRPIDRKLLATVLRSDQHHVIEAADGGEALEIVTLAPPDLVISDILMPSVDGYELVRRIREQSASRDVPVIFYTATYHAREARALAEECGVAAILTKPSSPSEVLDTVRRVLAQPPRPAGPADTARFDREHVKLVSNTLVAKIDDIEAGELRMTAIVEVARELSAEHDPSAMLRKVCGAAREVTLAQHGFLGVLDDAAQTTVALYTTGLDDESARTLTPPPITGSILERVVAERAAVRVNADGAMAAFRIDGRTDTAASLLAVPVATVSRVYGWLLLRHKLGAVEFSARDEELALTLATHAAIVFENIRLYEHQRRHAEALEQQIRERERAERALRDAHERTEFALASARTGVWEVDLRTGRVTWSKTYAELFGRTIDETPQTQEDFFALIHSDDRDLVRRTFEQALTGTGVFQLEFRSLLPDGSARWQDGRAKVLYEDNAPVRVLGVGIDITDRKLLEQQFRQAQKMEAIGQLAGGIAHDFNNLLTAILGNANLLQERLQETTGVAGNEVSEMIKAADRAAALTRQLLAFSRQQILQPAVLDLNALVEDMKDMLQRLIGENVRLVTTTRPGLGRTRADPTQLTQVIMNLVVNARDAMPVGGTLTIETANIDLEERHATEFADVPPGHYVMLAVTDTGTGIDEPTKRRLFEPFFTTKERGKGTGLGLATVYGIVKQSAGHIWVYSEIGRGTTFKIYLPAVDVGDADSVAPARRAPRGTTGSETILVVEDETAVLKLTQLVLERAGYHVIPARNAQEASEAFAEHADEIALLITDVVMPGASGPALLRHLAKRRSGLRVIYMSGYADDAIQVAGHIDPTAGFVQKPFSAEQLLRKVREALDR